MITGSCHCQTVRFEISEEIRGFMHCHCQTCRKIHGTVYGSSALVRKTGFKVVAGADSITAYESSPGKKRSHVGNASSQVTDPKKLPRRNKNSPMPRQNTEKPLRPRRTRAAGACA